MLYRLTSYEKNSDKPTIKLGPTVNFLFMKKERCNKIISLKAVLLEKLKIFINEGT